MDDLEAVARMGTAQLRALVTPPRHCRHCGGVALGIPLATWLAIVVAGVAVGTPLGALFRELPQIPIVYTCVYVGSGGSALLAGLMHAASNGLTPLSRGIDPVVVWATAGHHHHIDRGDRARRVGANATPTWHGDQHRGGSGGADRSRSPASRRSLLNAERKGAFE